jgi:hypothetical protein
MDRHKMILRLTAKLGQKIGSLPANTLAPDENPFADWVGHLFTAKRTQYIILSNTASLYSVIMYGRGITDDNDLIGQGISNMKNFMCDDGLEFMFRRFVVQSTGVTRYSKVNDKKLLGSIVEMTKEAQFWLTERELSPFETAAKINTSIFSYLQYNTPKEAFTQLKPNTA